jgi:glutamate dehydrogenase/leucine dehydrogenase
MDCDQLSPRRRRRRKEVEALAKTMEIKFTVSGPPIGGAKSGINFDPNDPRKKGVLERWYMAVIPLLKTYYGTGGDLNVDEINEVIPITENYGLWHPQEGVVNGHYRPRENEKIHKIGQLRMGVSKIIEDNRYSPDTSRKYYVADMITGFGVAESVRHYYEIYGGTLKGKRVLIQGWGNVAAPAAYYLAQEGAKIIGIIDRAGGLLDTNGFSFETIKDLFLSRKENSLVHEQLIPYHAINELLWSTEAEVFIPAAASRLVTMEQAEKLVKSGIELIACGANVPFAESEIFFGPVAEYIDHQVSLIPDFICNCGMARTFAYLMESNIEISDESIFKDVSTTIHTALHKIKRKNESPRGIARTALEIAISQLV